MKNRGLTPLEAAAFLALGSLAFLIAMPVGYRQLGKAHRQATTIRHWDFSLATAQEAAFRLDAPSPSKPGPTSHK